MYIVEITEDKVDNLIDHMSKGIKYFSKAIECLEEMKESSRMHHRSSDADGRGLGREREEMEHRYREDDDYPMEHRRGRSSSGRYSRY